MERDVFWDVFRDTGDPVCWLLTRVRAGAPEEGKDPPEQRAERPSAPR